MNDASDPSGSDPRLSSAEARARIAALEDELRSARIELQHRVRNTLSVIRSIARRTAKNCTDIEEYQMHLDGRLAALGRIQGALIRNPEAGLDLEGVVFDELEAFDAHRRIEALSGPPVRLDAKAAELIGLAVHELATNAVKFGALSNGAGRLAVGWTIEADPSDPTLRIEWRETGGPPIADGDKPRGFGSELLQQAIAYELAGATMLDFAPEGLICRISLPAGSYRAG
ncbi:MAG TPA: sensor histidine kinase [Sphingomonas sp.]|nr:sensor histidine kinase [Sphingomonas sp.]